MTITIARLKSWQPGVPDDAAYDLGRPQAALESLGLDLHRMLGRLAEAWEGEGHEAASGAVRRTGDAADELMEIVRSARRTLFAAADALAAAQAQLERALDMAAENTITLTSTGVLMPTSLTVDWSSGFGEQSPAVTNATRENVDEVARMIRAALAAAAEADRDAAAAIRTLLGGSTPAERHAAADTVLLAEVPPPGTPPENVLAWWENLSAAAQAMMLATYPELLGNRDGMPYDVRVAANRVNIANAIEESTALDPVLRAELSDVEARIAQMRARVPLEQAEVLELEDLQARQEWLNREISLGVRERAMYQDLLDGATKAVDANGDEYDIAGHQVVLFDPESGRFAEIVGEIGPGTRNIGVLVPGTGSTMLTMGGNDERALSFVTDTVTVNPPGSLAVISHLPGPMPQIVWPEAIDTSYAHDNAERVASFVNLIDNRSEATVTVVGHSYGGSVVGAAEVRLHDRGARRAGRPVRPAHSAQPERDLPVRCGARSRLKAHGPH